MTQPAMRCLLKDIPGVGKHRTTLVGISKPDWQVRQVDKALKEHATDQWGGMSVEDRKAAFVNLNRDGVPYMTINSAFTLKMLNGERDDTWKKKIPQDPVVLRATRQVWPTSLSVDDIRSVS